MGEKDFFIFGGASFFPRIWKSENFLPFSNLGHISNEVQEKYLPLFFPSIQSGSIFSSRFPLLSAQKSVVYKTDGKSGEKENNYSKKRRSERERERGRKTEEEEELSKRRSVGNWEIACGLSSLSLSLSSLEGGGGRGRKVGLSEIIWPPIRHSSPPFSSSSSFSLPSRFYKRMRERRGKEEPLPA